MVSISHLTCWLQLCYPGNCNAILYMRGSPVIVQQTAEHKTTRQGSYVSDAARLSDARPLLQSESALHKTSLLTPLDDDANTWPICFSYVRSLRSADAPLLSVARIYKLPWRLAPSLCMPAPPDWNSLPPIMSIFHCATS